MCIRDRCVDDCIGKGTTLQQGGAKYSYSGALADGLATVSYTHLDVYKRQVHVNDLMKNSGTSIHAMKSTSNKYKMFGLREFLYLNKLNLNKMNKIIGHAAEYTFDSIIGESEGIRQSIAIASEFATAGRNSVLDVYKRQHLPHMHIPSLQFSDPVSRWDVWKRVNFFKIRDRIITTLR